MNLSDPIADYLTRIRNAVSAGHNTVEIPYSKMKAEMSRILKSEGYIRSVTEEGEAQKKVLRLELKYGVDRTPVITGLKRVSKPGLRSYVKAAEVPRILGGLGIAILTTSKGIITDREARKSQTGGEILCEIW